MGNEGRKKPALFLEFSLSLERLEVPFTMIQKAEEESVLKGEVKNSQGE